MSIPLYRISKLAGALSGSWLSVDNSRTFSLPAFISEERVTAPNEILDDDPPPLTKPADLGFGRVVAQAGARALSQSRRAGRTARSTGSARSGSRASISPRSMRAGPPFFAWMMGVLLLINGCFALAYVALGDGALRGTEGMGIGDPVPAGVQLQRRRVHDDRHGTDARVRRDGELARDPRVVRRTDHAGRSRSGC